MKIFFLRVRKIIIDFFKWVIWTIGGLLILWSGALILNQIFQFLYSGHSDSYALINFANIFPYEFETWLTEPQQWIGLSKIATGIHVSVFIFLIAILFYFIAAYFENCSLEIEGEIYKINNQS